MEDSGENKIQNQTKTKKRKSKRKKILDSPATCLLFFIFDSFYSEVSLRDGIQLIYLAWKCFAFVSSPVHLPISEPFSL